MRKITRKKEWIMGEVTIITPPYQRRSSPTSVPGLLASIGTYLSRYVHMLTRCAKVTP